MEGFVHLWRQSLDSEVFQSSELWRLWTWCLLKANHRDVFVPLKIGKGSTVIKVKKGQFIFGRNSCSEALSWSPSTARNRMKKLAEMGNIIVESNNQYSIVTICNWSCFQGATEKIGQPKDNQRTTKGQPKDTDNNDNNDNKEAGNKYQKATAAMRDKIEKLLPRIESVYDFEYEKWVIYRDGKKPVVDLNLNLMNWMKGAFDKMPKENQAEDITANAKRMAEYNGPEL